MEGGETGKTEKTERLQQNGKERGKKEGRKRGREGLLDLWCEGYFKMQQSSGPLNTYPTVPPS